MSSSINSKELNSFRRHLQLSILLTLALLLLHNSGLATAAHSRTRYVVTRSKEPAYDRSITTFSAEGRLLQVEYGMEASQRGASVAAVRHQQDNSNKIVLVVRSLEKVYRIDEHVFLAAAGLQGDSRYIARQLRVRAMEHRIAYGEPPTVEEVAEAAAEMQHLLSRAGGARPLGCTAIILGIDPAPGGQLGKPKIFRTDPGGVIEEFEFCAAGQGQNQVVQAISDNLSVSRNNSDNKKYGVSKLVKSMINAMELKNDEMADVMIIQPDLLQRGNMKATVFRHAKKQNLQKIQDELDT